MEDGIATRGDIQMVQVIYRYAITQVWFFSGEENVEFEPRLLPCFYQVIAVSEVFVCVV